MDRVLSARSLDKLVRQMRDTEGEMASADEETQTAAMDRYPGLEERFTAAGGYAAESEAERITSNLGLYERVLEQSSARSRVVSAAASSSRASSSRVSGRSSLDEPTNHLDADSIMWLRDYLKSYAGGFIVISHDTELLRATVNKVFHLDANRGEMDQYSLGWDAYLSSARPTSVAAVASVPTPRRRPACCSSRPRRCAKATKAVAAQNMIRRAERMLSSLEGERVSDRVAKLRFPTPAPAAGRRSRPRA